MEINNIEKSEDMRKKLSSFHNWWSSIIVRQRYRISFTWIIAKKQGWSVTSMKLDPYINVTPAL
jgi:hypothetical protein